MTFDVAVVFCPFLCNLKSDVILNLKLSVGLQNLSMSGHGKWGYHCILGEFIQRKLSGVNVYAVIYLEWIVWNNNAVVFWYLH